MLYRFPMHCSCVQAIFLFGGRFFSVNSSVADFFSKYVLPLLREAMVRNYTKNTARLMLPKIIFLTESLIFGTVFPHALFLPPV